MDALRGTDPARIGEHTLLARLGAGGMGQVYLGRSPGGRLVAVKVIRDEITGHPEALARFRREAETVRAVRSACTANLIDASLASAPYWLATEYVAGPTLARAVAARGALPAGTCLRLMAALAEGLASVHAYGVTHRDLKPQNVILGAQGPQLIDFGIAKGVGATALTQDGQVPGTPGFTAPEVLVGGGTGTGAGGAGDGGADVFALGATMAYAATGRPPYGTGDAATVSYRAVHEPVDLAGVEPGLAELIGACVAKDPAQRPDPAEVVRRCGVRDALVDDPVYAGLGALGEQVPAAAPAPAPAPVSVAAPGAVQAAVVPVAVHAMPTEGPGYPYPPTRPTRPARRHGARTGAVVAVVAALALAAWKLIPPTTGDGGEGGDGAAGGGPSAQGRTEAPAASAPGSAAPQGAGRPPAEYIEGNRVSRYLWTGAPDRTQAAQGIGQCNQPAEEKSPGAGFQSAVSTTSKGGVPGGSASIKMRIKYAEMETSRPAPYYVSVAVKSPHDIEPGTGKPFPTDNRAVGYTSKPVDIYTHWQSGGDVELTYPDDFSMHGGGRTWPAVPLSADPGDWTVVFYHVEDDPAKYASIACSGFQVG
ncbi:serine/threonine-protein kinase [Streptomyces erythrochromogenes]|uniref:serine/threonine-protein kinase n=1 Tax=Streptomyces erythrochromogenes TaxID=285574 RepID=UPI003865EC35|nr:serine/threonine protein kinase [Streptomyces erythrochromogenes]